MIMKVPFQLARRYHTHLGLSKLRTWTERSRRTERGPGRRSSGRRRQSGRRGRHRAAHDPDGPCGRGSSSCGG